MQAYASIAATTVFLLLPTALLPAQRRLNGPAAEYFAAQTQSIADNTQQDLASVTANTWDATRKTWRAELEQMLGLDPLPPRTELKTTITGTLNLERVTIDRLHFQSRPGLYVAANYYRPTGEAPNIGWPAVLYVCGHAHAPDNGRLLGNKTKYQHHGLWLARHGVACLMIDTVQLGEFHGEHHGTYRLGRWDWMSRGYTPAGVEAWNAIRAIDVLCDKSEIDAERIGITGRSGGGAYSWFAAALDDRIRAAVPVAGITDLTAHVVDGCVEGHCDCMYFANHHGWDYGKLAALVAPRSLMLANSDSDSIFPLPGVMRIHQQLSDHYARLGAKDNLGLLITLGPHKDTQELQVGAFKWLLKHLTGKDIIIESAALKEVPLADLAVFEAETPRNQRVTSVGKWFVKTAGRIDNLEAAAQAWKTKWQPQLTELGVLPAKPSHVDFQPQAGSDTAWQLLQSENHTGGNINISVHHGKSTKPPLIHVRGVFAAENPTTDSDTLNWLAAFPDRTHYVVDWRGRNWLRAVSNLQQRHHILRRFYLLGTTAESVQLADLGSAIAWIRRHDDHAQLALAGSGRSAALAALAALWLKEPMGISELHLSGPTTDPMLAPSLLGILRVCDYASIFAAAEHSFAVHKIDRSPAPAEQNILIDTSVKPSQANGLRIVEVDQHSASIWVRATRWPLSNLGDLPKVKFLKPAPSGKRNQHPILPETGVDGLRFGVPGVPAQARVGYQTGNSQWKYTQWKTLSTDSDYSTLIQLSGLQPGQQYQIQTQVRALGSTGIASTLPGSFRTLPNSEQPANFRLAIGTCQDFNDRDGPHGFDLYRTLLERKTDAFVMAGDVVYYDALARSSELAFYHWQRTYSLPTVVNFHKQVPTYFLKDDHDTYVNDSWPGNSFDWTGEFRFEDGQQIFRQQTGLPTPGYRTFRITRDLQIWLTEGRDYRSPNTAPDGPDKSIWGNKQKAWLKETLDASTAKFKILISPTPIVGPDRKNKSDNHSNAVFATEGREIRKMLAAYPNLVAVCGDRHWQYHSVDPETKLHEFSVGPLSNRHAGGWRQDDYRPEIHRFLKVSGGYLEIDLSGDNDTLKLELNLRDVEGKLRHQHTLQ